MQNARGNVGGGGHGSSSGDYWHRLARQDALTADNMPVRLASDCLAHMKHQYVDLHTVVRSMPSDQ
jgi:hypothetical protein